MRGLHLLLWAAALLLISTEDASRVNAEPPFSDIPTTATRLDDAGVLPRHHRLMARAAHVLGRRGVDTTTGGGGGGGGGGGPYATTAAGRDAGTCNVAAPSRLPEGESPLTVPSIRRVCSRQWIRFNNLAAPPASPRHGELLTLSVLASRRLRAHNPRGGGRRMRPSSPCVIVVHKEPCACCLLINTFLPSSPLPSSPPPLPPHLHRTPQIAVGRRLAPAPGPRRVPA